ncbi:unnamed protein product, partial [Cladocopium goreaui]
MLIFCEELQWFVTMQICLPNKENPAKCESGASGLQRCQGKPIGRILLVPSSAWAVAFCAIRLRMIACFVALEKSDGSEGVPVCSDLSQDSCNGHYVADKDYLNNGLGYECHMKDDKTCGNGKLCGVQNPPESLGEKQCFVMASERCDAEPEVFKGATDGTCATFRTRPGQECKTRCYAGYSPSVAALKCNEDGQFEPKTFTCEPNPCTVKSVQNALASGCKEGPNSGEAVIQSGEVCTTQCKDGFYPSDKLLHCHSETLSPATFTCESPCVVPTVANAAGGGVCKE